MNKSYYLKISSHGQITLPITLRKLYVFDDGDRFIKATPRKEGILLEFLLVSKGKVANDEELGESVKDPKLVEKERQELDGGVTEFLNDWLKDQSHNQSDNKKPPEAGA